MRLTKCQIATREAWMRAHTAHRIAPHGFREVTRRRLYEAVTRVLQADIAADNACKRNAGRHYTNAGHGEGVSSGDVSLSKPASSLDGRKRPRGVTRQHIRPKSSHTVEAAI